MNRLNRRRFLAVTSVTATSALLVACGNDPISDEELRPTQIPDVPGAPPTIAPLTSTPGAEPAGDAPAGDGGGTAAALTIEASDDFKFTPKDAEVSPGQTVTVHNVGFMQHDLVCNDLGIGTELLDPDGTEDIVIPEDATVGETYSFHCTVAGHEQAGMVGSFIIVEAGAAAPAEEEAPAEGAGGPAEALTIETSDDFKFTPKDSEVSPGQTITVHNVGFMQHDLDCEGLGIKTELLDPDASEDIVIPEDAAIGETFTFKCTVAGHEQAGMVGSFTIVEAGAGPAAGGEEEAPAEDAPAGEAAAGPAEALTIETSDDFKFTPKDSEVSPGQTITVHNVGFLQHDLVSDDLGIGTELLNPDASEDIVIPEDAAIGETFTFKCTVAGHEQAGMVGSFTIVEAGAGPAAGGEEEPATEEATAEETEAVVDEATAVASPATENTPEAVTVVGTKWQFEPADFEIAPGGVITFQNNTGMSMGLSAEPWNQNALTPMIKSVSDGSTGEFVVPADAQVGDVIEYASNLTEAENQGMVGTITIVAGSGANAAATPDVAATPAIAVSGSGNVVEVKTLDAFAFDPKEIEVSAGDTLRFVNEGFLQHDAKVDAWGDDPLTPLLLNGESADFVVPDSVQAGEEYEVYCTVAGHLEAGMKAAIKIV